MKRYSAAALIISAVLALTAFTACGSKSKGGSDKPATAEEIKEPEIKVLDETDFMECFLTDGGTNYLGMTIDEFNEKTDNVYVEKNAVEYDMDYDYAKYSYGELDSLFCGRAKFDVKLPVTVQFTYGDGKIKKITYIIDQGDVAAKSVSDSLSACLNANLPEDYKAEYDRPAQGKDSAVFANTVDGYVFTVEHVDLDGSGYPVKMSLESYKDKYGME